MINTIFLNELAPSKIAGIVFFSVFLVFALIELVLAFIEKEKARKFIKIFCIPSLLISVACTIPSHPLVYLALLAGSIGDICLIFKGKYALPIGVIAFFCGHLLYLSELYNYYLHALVPWWYYLVFLSAIFVLASLFILILKGRAKKRVILIGGAIYYATLCGAIISSIVALSFIKDGYFYLMLLGYLVFISSDVTLLINKYVHPFKRSHFYIMGTYLLAQCLITSGFILNFLYIL